MHAVVVPARMNEFQVNGVPVEGVDGGTDTSRFHGSILVPVFKAGF